MRVGGGDESAERLHLRGSGVIESDRVSGEEHGDAVCIESPTGTHELKSFLPGLHQRHNVQKNVVVKMGSLEVRGEGPRGGSVCRGVSDEVADIE